MSDLILELYSEEIPALMQKPAAKSLLDLFKNLFNKYDIIWNLAEEFAGPCRITVHFTSLSLQLTNIKVKGPAVGVQDEILAKFCIKYNITKTDLIIDEEKGKKYFYLLKNQEQDLEEILLQEIPKVLSSLIWPKSMRWGEYQISWIRPLKNILCLFDGKILPIKYGHLKASNITFGHKFFANIALKINSWQEYQDKLLQNYVILSERKKIILEQINKICRQNKIVLNDDPCLLDEIEGLVEYPTMLFGDIDQKFMDLPPELLILCLKVHQRYLTCSTLDGKLANKFIFASNLPVKDFRKVIEGNKKVLSARLNDALYFYKQDLQEGLESKFDALSKVVFHLKLGSIKDKALRLEKICKYLNPDDKNLATAAKFSKCDLLTQVVKEFPELQGIISKYYAENKEIGEIISNHYSPKGANDTIPKLQSSILSLADKLDTLVGLFIVGEKVTSSKDPYALRRSAIGILRIILHHKLKIDLDDLINYIIKLYDQSYEIKYNHQEVFKALQTFILDKFDGVLAGIYDPKVTQLIITNDLTDIIKIADKSLYLGNFYQSDDFKFLVAGYKRLNNIIGAKIDLINLDPQLLENIYEKNLYKILNQIDKQDSLSNALALLTEIVTSLNELLDNVMINVIDNKLAQNRLALLCKIKDIFDHTLHFRCLI